MQIGLELGELVGGCGFSYASSKLFGEAGGLLTFCLSVLK